MTPGGTSSGSDDAAFVSNEQEDAGGMGNDGRYMESLFFRGGRDNFCSVLARQQSNRGNGCEKMLLLQRQLAAELEELTFSLRNIAEGGIRIRRWW